MGTYQNDCHDKYAITSEAQRNSLFRNQQLLGMDEFGGYVPKNRFDNTSFIRSLNSSISQNSVDSNTDGSTTTSSNNSKEKLTSKGHHHSSIHEMIKNLGKKVHIWPRNRHDSINEREISKERNTLTPEPHIDNFRLRSKSLDVSMSRRILDDCESTYKIYNKILKEGKNSNLRKRNFYCATIEKLIVNNFVLMTMRTCNSQKNWTCPQLRIT